MNESDLNRVAAIERECFSDPWSREAYFGILGNPSYAVWCAEESGQVIGFAAMQWVLDEGYICNIAVMEEHRRKGAAHRLIDALCKTAGEQNLSFLTLEVRESNLAARNLYERHGFRIEGRRKNYYQSPPEDAILMTKNFEDQTEV